MLPGLLGDIHFEGNHQLIKQGANLASSPEDIFEYLNSSLQWLTCVNEYQQKQITEEYTTLINNEKQEIKVEQFTLEQQKAMDVILPFLRFNKAVPIDIIAQDSGLSTSELAPLLLELELIEKVAIVAGGYTRLE